MVVYYEYLFFINLIINYLTVRLTEKIISVEVSKKRFFIASVLVVLIVYLNTIIYIKFFNILYGLVIGASLFKNKKSSAIFCYYFINIFLGGITHILNGYIFIGIISLIVIFEIINYMLEKKLTNKFFYNLMIRYNDKSYCYKAFLDTGFNVISSKGLPIILINDYAYGKYVEKIQIHTAIGIDNIQLYKPDVIMIKKGENYEKIDAYIAFSAINYEALLSINIFKWG